MPGSIQLAIRSPSFFPYRLVDEWEFYLNWDYIFKEVRGKHHKLGILNTDFSKTSKYRESMFFTEEKLRNAIRAMEYN
jgi:hypothetical protein